MVRKTAKTDSLADAIQKALEAASAASGKKSTTNTGKEKTAPIVKKEPLRAIMNLAPTDIPKTKKKMPAEDSGSADNKSTKKVTKKVEAPISEEKHSVSIKSLKSSSKVDKVKAKTDTVDSDNGTTTPAIETSKKTSKSKVVEKSVKGKSKTVAPIIKNEPVVKQSVPIEELLFDETEDEPKRDMSKGVTVDNSDFDIRQGWMIKCRRKNGELIVPDGVIETGYYVAANKAISALMLPKTLEIIGRGSFFHCYNIQQLVLPTKLSIINDNAFGECKMLATVEFNKGLKSIGKKAFSGCTSLKNIKIPSSVEKIGAFAFAECTGLVNIQIPEKTVVADNAFDGCLEDLIIKRY